MLPCITCEILYDIVALVWCMPVLLFAGITYATTSISVAIFVYISMFMHLLRAAVTYGSAEHPCPEADYIVCTACGVALGVLVLPPGNHGQLGPVAVFMAVSNSALLAMKTRVYTVEL